MSVQRHNAQHLPQALTHAAARQNAAREDSLRRVVEQSENRADDVYRFAIAVKSKRLERLNERFQQLEAIRADRAKCYRRMMARAAERLAEAEAKGDKLEMAAAALEPVPGAETGLLVRTLKTVAGGCVEEWKLDTGLLEEERKLMEQAARELGDLPQPNTANGSAGGNMVLIFNGAPSRQVPGDIPVLDLPKHVESVISQRVTNSADPTVDDEGDESVDE
jgi:hypothetical protein